MVLACIPIGQLTDLSDSIVLVTITFHSRPRANSILGRFRAGAIAPILFDEHRWRKCLEALRFASLALGAICE